MDPFSTLSGKQRDLIESLAVASVDCVVIGGYAMRFHGLERPAKDLDLLVGYDPENADKLFDLLSCIGTIDPLSGRRKLATPKMQVKWFDVEFLTSIDGIEFGDVRRRASRAIVEGFSVLVASAEDMLTAKRIAGMLEDGEDIQFVKRIISAV
jgi:hypothetical protein